MITFKKLGQMGRMGNAMFQIAACIGVESEGDDDAVFPIWEYASHFKKPICQLPISEITYNKYHRERGFTYKPIKYTRRVCLEGYFQSELYFKHCEEKIREMFQPNPVIEKSLDRDFKNTCGIHVRRTDYLQLADFHVPQKIEYYHEAMDKMGDKKFLVFSDDLQWCKENFNGVEFMEESDIVEFFLLSRCESKIIANSSFSWWAAWLGEGRVIAPKNWFGHTCRHSTDTLYAEGWEII